MPCHRSFSLAAIGIIVILLLRFLDSPKFVEQTTSSKIAGFSSLEWIPRPKLITADNLRLSINTGTQEPPAQNVKSWVSSWYSGWKWLNPFSSIILEEERTGLPPLRKRQVVYTFHQPKPDRSSEEQEADHELLLTWRRAWYAKGFEPVVLIASDGRINPLYKEVARAKLDPELELEFLKWLAWGHMGTGILVDWRCVPMARYDDDFFSELRRGVDESRLIRIDKLGPAFFAGGKDRINDAIRQAIKNVRNSSTSTVARKDANGKPKSILDFIPQELFSIERTTSLAYYGTSTVESMYPALAEQRPESTAVRQLLLAEVINSHLHNTFLDGFQSGIAVLKPFPNHTTALVEPAMNLAKTLATCPRTVLPLSCPPSHPACSPCASRSNRSLITILDSFDNSSDHFTISLVPHPYTLLALFRGSDHITTRYIRRETPRDPWLHEVTKSLLGPERGSASRLEALKDAVAGEAASRTLWLTLESLLVTGRRQSPTFLDDLEWKFGFKLPRDDEIPETAAQAKVQNSSLQREKELISKTLEATRIKTSNRIGIQGIAEAWNMADTEIWQFVRAFWYVFSVGLYPYRADMILGNAAFWNGSNGRNGRRILLMSELCCSNAGMPQVSEVWLIWSKCLANQSVLTVLGARVLEYQYGLDSWRRFSIRAAIHGLLFAWTL